jgi:hypothetical protein
MRVIPVRPAEAVPYGGAASFFASATDHQRTPLILLTKIVARMNQTAALAKTIL